MNVTFSTQDILAAIIVALVVGGIIGAILYKHLVTEDLRRRLDVDRTRLIRTQARQHQGTPYIRTGREW